MGRGMGETWEATARSRGHHTVISMSTTGTWGLWMNDQPQTGRLPSPHPTPKSPPCPVPVP